MDKPTDGGPAYPNNWGTAEGEKGLSIRDYFAGQVLPGCCAATSTPGDAAKAAYDIADAMLAERAKERLA